MNLTLFQILILLNSRLASFDLLSMSNFKLNCSYVDTRRKHKRIRIWNRDGHYQTVQPPPLTPTYPHSSPPTPTQPNYFPTYPHPPKIMSHPPSPIHNNAPYTPTHPHPPTQNNAPSTQNNSHPLKIIPQ